LGDAGTVAGDLRLSLGSNVTVSNAITVASSAATNVYFDRGGGSGNATFSGAITLGRDLTLRQSTTDNRTLALNSSSTVGGTGNLIVGSSVASAGAVNLQGGINMDGILINQSTLATGTVTVSGAIGATVKGVTQNSATSSMTLSNASNAYTGTTTVTAGTLNISGAGDIGDSDLVLGGGTFTITSATTGLTLGASQAVTGVGTIITTGKSFVVNGRFAPGTSVGAIAVTGNFTLGGSTEMELAGTGGVPGTDFDFLSVSGVLNLGGTLSILGAGGFSLDSLGSYNLFDASSFASNFSGVQVGSTALAFSGGEWIGDSDLSSYSFSPTTGVLTVVAVPEPASLALVAVALGLAAARKATANGSRRF
jgi:fibronectin-binding autotransporter adhesin